MVPLTDATIAFMVGGVLDVRDWSTLVINRELASWFRSADADDAPLAELAPEATPARVAAPGPKVLTLQSGDRPRRHAGTSPRGPKSR